jgi:phosphomethylpyrimidine synthase
VTQLELAKKGLVSPQMEFVAEKEGLEPEPIRVGLGEGTIVVPANCRHTNLKPCGIGRGLYTKVNANVGTSSDYGTLATELGKVQACMEYKADTVMDLSTGGNVIAIRQSILASCPLPMGTVPLYQAGIESVERRGAIVDMTADDLFAVIEQQAEDGVDFMTVHCGVTQKAIDRLRNQGRVTNVVSRGGAFLIGWMLHQDKENPLYEQYDRLLDIAVRYDVTLSLGDGMRPGSLADATDRCQIEELLTLGELVERARTAGVQVMVEGPGHLPLDQIVANVQLEKRLCQEAPFYVLGPLVTDIAAGYDHITAAIGGAIAAAAGADFLCYVTPSEHLSLPDVNDVREGIIGARIAAHAADIVKRARGAADWDRRMSTARRNLDWQEQVRLSLDPSKARSLHDRFGTKGETCSMCGPYCAMALVEKYLGCSVAKCAL